MKKLKSRKLWIAILMNYGLLMMGSMAHSLDERLSCFAMMTIITVAYIIGQSVVDSSKDDVIHIISEEEMDRLLKEEINDIK